MGDGRDSTQPLPRRVLGLAEHPRAAQPGSDDLGGRGFARARLHRAARVRRTSHSHIGKAGVLTIGLGITAYTLGLRHAFDADHISAIDNTTRKLMAEGKRPLSVGFWFSLGHSTVVFALTLLISVGVRSLNGPVREGHSTLHQATSLVGTAVSAGFLYLIAAVNLVILLGIVKVFREMRTGRYDEAGLERQLESRGLMNRVLGRVTRAVPEPRHMYPVGLLFGLGFDTASEVALLVIAGGAGAAGLPWYAILSLPILFAAGMSLMDTIDGSFMNFAYGWALSKPVRKVFYNLTITGLSVAVALVIGTIEIGGLISSKLNLSGPFWNWLENVNINLIGFVIVRHVHRHLADRALDLAARADRGALVSPPERLDACGLARPDVPMCVQLHRGPTSAVAMTSLARCSNWLNNGAQFVSGSRSSDPRSADRGWVPRHGPTSLPCRTRPPTSSPRSGVCARLHRGESSGERA